MKTYLPRFQCPKSMTSKIYIDKKTKAKSRRNLNRRAKLEAQD